MIVMSSFVPAGTKVRGSGIPKVSGIGGIGALRDKVKETVVRWRI
jgi:hypothetical protein